MYDLLKSRSAALRGEAVALARRLVMTSSPSLHEEEAAACVTQAMREAEFDDIRRDEAGNVVGCLRGREAAPTLLLLTHLDTASPGDLSEWKESPFSGRVADGRLHGLGAADCKGGIAAQVCAMQTLKRSLLPLRGNIVVAVTVAEEAGGSAGTRVLMDRTLPALELKPSIAVLGEPTDLSLYYGHDGWTKILVTVQGVDPFHVNDAAHAIHADLQLLREQRAAHGGPEIAAAVPAVEDTGGVWRARMDVHRRLAAADNASDVAARVRREAELVAMSAGQGVVDAAVCEEDARLYTGHNTRVARVTPPWRLDPFNPLMLRARQALAAAGLPVRAGCWQVGRPDMGTAGGVLMTEYDVPVIGFGPGEEAQAHAPNESVSVELIAQAVYGTAAIAHALVGVPVCGWSSDEI